MLTTAIAFVLVIFPLLGVGAQIPTGLSSFPSWGLRRDAFPNTHFYDSWRQQYQKDTTRTLLGSLDKPMNYATPPSNVVRNYKHPLIPRYYRSYDKYEPYIYDQNQWNPRNVYRYPYDGVNMRNNYQNFMVYNQDRQNPQTGYRYPMEMYEGTVSPINRGIIESAAAAVGITIPIEINVRDTVDAMIKYLQSLGIIRLYPSKSNTYFTTESYVPESVREDYIQKPMSDVSTPASFVQFNIFQLDGRPQYGEQTVPVSVQGDPEYRPGNVHTNCGTRSPGMIDNGSADPNRRVIHAPPPYWMYNPY